MIVGYFHRVHSHRPMITLNVTIGVLSNRPQPIAFLLDTGADRTILTPFDAARFGVTPAQFRSPPPAWPRPSRTIGLSGGLSIYPFDARVEIAHHDGRQVPYTGSVLVAAAGMTFPHSLLGWDVLGAFEVILDPARRQVVLL